MKDKLITFILIFIMLILIVTLGIFGFSIYLAMNGQETVVTQMLSNGYNYVSGDIEEKKSEQNQTDNNILDNLLSSFNSTEKTQEEIDAEKNEIIQNENKDLYYYEQLSEYSKIIYKAIEQNIENMENGNYKIVLGDYFTELLEQENGQELLGKYYQSAVETYLYDNPEVFFLNPSKMYLNIQTTTTTSKFLSMMGKSQVEYQVSISCGEQENYYADNINSKEQIDQYQQQLEQEVNNILAKVKGKTNYEKLFLIHEYLVDNLEYDQELDNEHIYNIYGALVNKECVCEGYAKAFKYLINKSGIECIIVIGKAKNSSGKTENHAWNYVKLENTWYAVDCTWDDPIIIGNGKLDSKYKYRYFLLGGSEINEDHVVSEQFTDNGQEYTHPVLSENKYKR